MMVYNVRGFEKVFDYARKIGADARADHRIVAKKNGDLVTLKLRADEEDLMPLYRGGFTPCAVPGEQGEDPRSDGPLCAAANRYANITSAGEVRACNILPGVAGTLLEHSFREIWEGSPWMQTDPRDPPRGHRYLRHLHQDLLLRPVPRPGTRRGRQHPRPLVVRLRPCRDRRAHPCRA